MEPQNLDIASINLDRWVDLMNHFLDTPKGLQGGHWYIDLTGKQIRKGPSSQFTLLTLEKIENITREKILSDNTDTLRKAHALILRLKEMEKNPSGSELKTLFQRLALGDKKLDEASIEGQAPPYVEMRNVDLEGNLISKFMRERVLETLSQTTGILQSRIGTSGVFTLISSHSNLMFKLLSQEEIAKHLIADKFFKKMGFVTPEYSALNCSTATGKTLCLTILRLPEGARKVRKSDSFVQEMEAQPYLLVMKYIDATPFNQLTFKDVEEIFVRNVQKYPGLFRSLGKMVLFDTFCKNADRLNWVSCNTGNILLDLSRINEDNPICLIDHDFELQRPFVRGIKENIHLLFHCLDLKSTCLSKLIDVLYNDFFINGQCPAHSLEGVQRNFVKENLGKGVMLACEELLAHFSHHPSLEKLFELPPPLKTVSAHRGE